MAKDVLHVVPHEQAWAVRREGNERVSSTHPTQREAIEAARELAKERDDLVIHRPDGTIRERVTYSGGQDQSNGAAGGERRGVAGEPDLRDRVSVGTRVSWSAVLAGAVVALATYFLLSLLALAIGLSTADQVSGRTFTTTAAVVAGLALLASLFLGGYVASLCTAGERPGEGAGYGVLVWGAMMMLLAAGLSFGLPGGARLAAPAANANVSTDRVRQELGLNDQQAERYTALIRDSRGQVAEVNPSVAAWWAFGGVALSLLAAMAGGWFGAGPQLVLRRDDARPSVAVPHPA